MSLSYSEMKDLVHDEFLEYTYAKYSPLGATAAIIRDYSDEFRENVEEYYGFFRALYLINCDEKIITWYREFDNEFLVERIQPVLLEHLAYEPYDLKLLLIMENVNKYLSLKTEVVPRADIPDLSDVQRETHIREVADDNQVVLKKVRLSTPKSTRLGFLRRGNFIKIHDINPERVARIVHGLDWDKVKKYFGEQSLIDKTSDAMGENEKLNRFKL